MRRRYSGCRGFRWQRRLLFLRWDSAALDLGGKTSDFYKIPIFLQNPAENHPFWVRNMSKYKKETQISTGKMGFFFVFKGFIPKNVGCPLPIQRILLFAPFIVILQIFRKMSD